MCLVRVEAFVPGPDHERTAGVVVPRTISADRVVLSVSRRDSATQTVAGSYVDITEAGIRLRPWHIRYLSPPQLDAMAAGVGLDLVARHSGWREEPFDEDSPVHVSTYAPVRR
ncbi:hypothetical protein BH24ACT3_BH24ACT3_07160 [soil metagenome]